MKYDSTPARACYTVALTWSDNIKIDIELRHPHIEYVIRWLFSSVKTVKIDSEIELPADIIELLLKNPNFTKLELYKYESSTVKRLTESRRFDYVYIEPSIYLKLSDINIDIKELEFRNFSLEEILKTESIKTKSLVAHFELQHFDEGFNVINISPGFESIEKFQLNVGFPTGFNPQKILQFLEYLNANLLNLEHLVLNLGEVRPNLIYNKCRESFNMPSNFIKNLVNYEDKFTVYNGRARVELNHYIDFDVVSSSKQAVESYYEEIKEELHNFQNSSLIEDRMTYYNFDKLSHMTGNFELNIHIELTYYDRYS
ncbi:hypothetical protein FO519_008449 [Halicephalobus sp. NKZ332]|nr:hypothetical protein FO519_008449 [Halicephalobus sp. NKZ332]